MSAAHPQPGLRLVGSENPLAIAAWRDEASAARDIAAENRRAAKAAPLDPADPRWVLAIRAASQLQGSALSPERREQVMRIASLLGVRPFDANVIIAIVQDQARRGEPLAEGAPMIAMVPEVVPPSQRTRAWVPWVAALTTAAVINAFLIWWLVA